MKKLIIAVCALITMIFAAGCAPKVYVETRGASGITDNDAVVNGYIGEYEKMPTNVGIFFGESETDMEKIVRDKHPNNLLSGKEIDVDYDIAIDGGVTLKPSTTYYYQFFARMDGKDVLGEVKSFTTAAEPKEANITIETEDADDVTATNATLLLKCSNYEKKPDEVGVYLGESETELKKIARKTDPMHLYDVKLFEIWFDVNIDIGMRLKPSTTYYFQCYAKDGDAEKRGEIKSFTTLAE